MRTYQFGDIAHRLAQALGLQGRDAFAVEESILPVAQVVDASALPYATEPRAVTCFGDATGAVGNSPHLGLTLTGSGKLWIRQLVMVRPTSAGAVEINRSGRIETDGTFTDRAGVDTSSNNAPNQGPQFLPLKVRQWTVQPAAIGSGVAAQFRMAQNAPLVWPVDVVLSPGECFYAKTLDTAVQLTTVFQGLYYPSLST